MALVSSDVSVAALRSTALLTLFTMPRFVSVFFLVIQIPKVFIPQYNNKKKQPHRIPNAFIPNHN